MSRVNLRFAACLIWLCVLPAFAQPTAAAEPATSAAQLNFLRDAITNTPYSALVVHTKVEITAMSARAANSKKVADDESGEERHIYHARVLETFKGKSYTTIRYEMVVEKGESASVDSEPQLLTLCLGKRGFYWPGTGASFPGDTEFIAEARRVAKRPVKNATKSSKQCDWGLRPRHSHVAR